MVEKRHSFLDMEKSALFQGAERERVTKFGNGGELKGSVC